MKKLFGFAALGFSIFLSHYAHGTGSQNSADLEASQDVMRKAASDAVVRFMKSGYSIANHKIVVRNSGTSEVVVGILNIDEGMRGGGIADKYHATISYVYRDGVFVKTVFPR